MGIIMRFSLEVLAEYRFVIRATKETGKFTRFIIKDLDRTATCVPCAGLYTQEEKQMLMLVVHQKEVDYVTTRIKRVCPETFIIVSDAYDAYGERWNHLPEPGDLVMR